MGRLGTAATDSVAVSRVTDRVLVLSLLSPPNGLLVTVTATFFLEGTDDSVSTLLMSISGGGGVVGSPPASSPSVVAGEVFAGSSTDADVVGREELTVGAEMTEVGRTRTLRPGLRDLTVSERALVSAGLRGFRVRMRTRVFADEISGVRVRTTSGAGISDEKDPLRLVGSGSGVVGLCTGSGRAVGAGCRTALLMPSSRRYVSIARLTSVVDLPNDRRPKCTVSGPEPRLRTPSMIVGWTLMLFKATGDSLSVTAEKVKRRQVEQN